MTGILTGIPDLDRLIFCLEPGDLAVIGARPAVGKSAFGMQIALNAARQGRHVLVCSREMRQMQYAHRIAAHLSGINSARLRRGALSQEEWGELAGCCGEMGRLPLAFTFDSATVEELRVQAQREKELGNLDLLVVDYLQILRTSARLQKRYEAVGHVSRALQGHRAGPAGAGGGHGAGGAADGKRRWRTCAGDAGPERPARIGQH